MLVGYGIEEPLDIILGADNAWQTEDLNGGIVGMNAHIHVAFLASRHDGLQEILHVGTELRLVDTFVQVEEIAELLDGSIVVLTEVSADEALCLDDDRLHQLVIFLGRHGLGQFISFSQDISSFAYTFGELELRPFLTGTFTLQDIDVEVGELSIVEIQVRGAVGIGMQQIRAGPVEHRHEVIANGVDALCREVAQTLLIDLDLLVAVGSAIFDGFHYGQ